MATQEAAFGDEEFDLDEKCVGENDLKKLKSSHFTVIKLYLLLHIKKDYRDIELARNWET